MFTWPIMNLINPKLISLSPNPFHLYVSFLVKDFCNLNEAILIFKVEMAVTWVVCQSGQHSVSFTENFFSLSHIPLFYYQNPIQFSSVQFSHSVWFFVTPWTAAHKASLSITNSQSLPKLMSIELVMPSNHLILCHPLLLLPSIFPNIRVFSSESALLLRWPKYWSFSFSISPSNEHPGLIYFKMDWLDILAVQGTLKSLLQHHSSKASILWCSAFFNSHVHTWPLEKP